MSNIVTYHLNASNHQNENIMLNEPISYKEDEFAINNLNVRKVCGVESTIFQIKF